MSEENLDFSGQDNHDAGTGEQDAFGDMLGPDAEEQSAPSSKQGGDSIENAEPVNAEDVEAVITDDGIMFPNYNNTNQADQTDNSQKPVQSSDGDQKQTQQKYAGKFESVEDMEKAYQNLEKEYTQKSQTLGEMKPVLPIIDAMMKDENLVSHVENYFNESGKSDNARSDLGLDDDFYFDSNEAMNNPESDSAKALQQMVQKTVAQTVDKKTSESQAKLQRQTEEDAFMKEHGMSRAELDSMMDKASQHRLSLEDIHYLVNKEKIAAENERTGQTKVMNQMRKGQELGSSKANQGSQQAEQPSSPEDVMMNWLSQEDTAETYFG